MLVKKYNETKRSKNEYDFYEAVKNLYDAMGNLLDVWFGLDPQIHDDLTEVSGYPFHLDFHELTLDAKEWVQNVKSFVKEREVKKKKEADELNNKKKTTLQNKDKESKKKPKNQYLYFYLDHREKLQVSIKETDESVGIHYKYFDGSEDGYDEYYDILRDSFSWMEDISDLKWQALPLYEEIVENKDHYFK